MNEPRDKSYADSIGNALTDPVEAAAYLDAVMELEDHAALLVALRQVAKVHGMAEVARRAEVGDKTLFKALSEHGNPTLETVNKGLHAVGLRFSVAPVDHDSAHA
jgi:probable addiction module antidote protein